MKAKVTDSTSRLTKYLKPIYQKIRYFSYPKSDVLLIMGCQRSGTTLVSRVLDSFLFCRVFGEFSELSSNCSMNIRLNKISRVVGQLQKTPAPLIVMKPLVESHRANELLTHIPNSRIIWVYRYYIDVALSDIKLFKSTAGHGNLKPIIEQQEGNWRVEGLSKETIELVKSIYHDALSPFDCACLFWFVRNSLFFQQNLNNSTNVYLWRYESLMENPKEHFLSLSKELDYDLASYPFNQKFSKESINKNLEYELNPKIKKICDDMMSKLISVTQFNS